MTATSRQGRPAARSPRPASASGTNTSGRSLKCTCRTVAIGSARPDLHRQARASDVSALMPRSRGTPGAETSASRSSEAASTCSGDGAKCASRQPERRRRPSRPRPAPRATDRPRRRVHPRASSRQNRASSQLVRHSGVYRASIVRRSSAIAAAGREMDSDKVGRQQRQQFVDPRQPGELPAKHGQLLAYVHKGRGRLVREVLRAHQHHIVRPPPSRESLAPQASCAARARTQPTGSPPRRPCRRPPGRRSPGTT